jgi:putative methionine-R-sulfoxide reductase with GAF domain
VPAEDQERILGNALGFQPAFRQLALFNAEGELLTQSSRLVQARSQEFENLVVDQVFAQIAQTERYISPVTIDNESSEPLIIIAVPIFDLLGDFQGMLAAELNLKFMWDLVDQLKVGETGFAYVADRQGNLLAFADTARVLRGENVSHLVEVGEFVAGENVDETGANIGPGITEEDSVQTFVALGSPDWAVFTEVPTAEAFQAIIQNIVTAAVIIVVIAGVATASGVVIARRIADPLTALTETAAQIAEGNLDLEAKVQGNLEVVQLAAAFNNMTAQLRSFIDSLEQRVADRTRALEISGNVSRQISNILERDKLVQAVVEQVKESFDYYHAHIYLFDDAAQNLIMVGGTGEAGQQMLAEKHQIPAGKGLVGRAGQTGQPVLVPNTAQAEDWLPNPLLPDTKAEIAVPIMSGDKVRGVLDVQHNVTDGLNQADVDLLESIANQVAVALRNANLYEEAQERAKREALMNEINQKIANTKDVQEAMQVAVREIGRATGASATSVRLASTDAQNGS